MAEIGGGGTPANDAERLVIAHLRDHAPDDWFVLHNIEIPVRGDAYEVDLVVVTGHAVCVIDVKGTRGRTDVSGFRWYPENRGSFASPVRKLRGHARALKGLLERSRPELSQVYVDQLVVLPAPDAVLVDPSDRPDADARDVTDLQGLIPALADISRIRVGMSRDIRSVSGVVRQALSGGVRRPSGPKRFGEWLVSERLGGDDDVTEYRARNGNVPTAETVLLRVYRADPFLPAAQREAQQHAIANAYEVLAKMPASPYVVGRRTFFPVEDESQFVLVLDDVRGQALAVHVADPRRALGADAKLRVIGDMVRGLAHAHASSVLHRALSPATVLVVAGSGQALLTGFDFGRPEQPRPHTVLPRLAEEVDPAYVAPECQGWPQAMSRASDVYAAGVIAFRLLTGELPFADSADQFRSGSELPAAPMAAAGLGADLVGLLRRMCARSPSARPTAGDAVRDLARIVGAGRTPTTTGSASGVARVDYRNLPSGYQLSRKFTVRRKLGTGSFGTAYQAYDTMSGTDRVVKVVHTDRQSVLDRVRGEYQILSRLPPHRSVVKVEDANFLDGGIPYLEFEYVDGREVSELVEERALGPADTVQLGIDIADGLTYLHENGVYHCDIKPKNLLRTDAGGKIFDFNVAVTSDSSLSGAGGTGRYVPPDTGGGATTGADLIDRDVYALGVTLYEVLTGAAPFTGHAAALGERPADPRGRSGLIQLSDELVAVLLRAVAPFRSERYRSAREFREALREVADRTQRPAAPEPADPGALSEPGVGINPFVAHLRTLYSQSTSTNAGTRSGPASPYDLYVRTALDDQLTPDVRRGDHRLVIITGNAGDGKTAYLERLLTEAWADDPRRPIRRDNGADFQLPDGRWLRVTYDGSQDEGEKSNDEVLLDFFASFAGADPAGIPDETRLIAINEGRLVDFFDVHADRFPALAARVHAGLTGSVVEQGIAVINLNRRSLLHTDDEDFPPVFDRMLSTLTDPRRWTACEGCELIASCYARHNARTFAHAGAGPKISARLRHLFRLTELRGAQHLTVSPFQPDLAGGRACWWAG